MTGTLTWKCQVCGYEHTGDEPPGTCPVCGVGAEMFEPLQAEPASDGREDRPSPVRATDWRCQVCGYEHTGNSPPATCPVCGVGAEMFEPVEEAAEPDAEEPPEPAAEDASEDQPSARLLILGGGIAALRAAEAARREDPRLEITLVTRESTLPCQRLQLTLFLAGETAFEDLLIHPEKWYRDQRIRLVLDEGIRLDLEERVLWLRESGSLPWDRLVLANGSHPFVPPIPGIHREGVTPLRTVAHAQGILEQAQAGLPAAVIGGGLLGLETAAALARRGMEVTVIEGSPGLMARQLAEPAGQVLREHLESQGLTVHCEARVERIAGDETVGAVVLEGGHEVPARLLVLATGVRPNTFLPERAGLRTERGVVVDDRLRTSHPQVWAAGDVCEYEGRLYGLWTAASEQGAVAGTNVAGGDRRYTGPRAATTLKVVDLDVFSVGRHTPSGEDERALEHRDGSLYVRVVLQGDRVVGANLVGGLAWSASLREAARQGRPFRELDADLRALLAPEPSSD